MMIPGRNNSNNNRDEQEIRIYFDAMDQRKRGALTLDEFYTLYLGLGYPRMDQNVLASKLLLLQGKQQEDAVTLPMALKFLTKLTRNQEPSSSFFQLLDSQSKGKIDASDVLNLSKAVGEPISMKEAEAMLEVTFGKNSAKGRGVSESQFKRFVDPPNL